MTVHDLTAAETISVLVCPQPERVIGGVYIGDLLSWVMGRAKADDAWLTIMSNINIAAVAALTDTACIVLCEGVVPDEAVLQAAQAKEINILCSSLPAYETALLLHAGGV